MGEILVGVLISGGFLLIGIIATIVGQEYSARSNHKRKLEIMKKELVFNKKIAYFERISKVIEDYTKNYASLLFLIGDVKQTELIWNLPNLKTDKRTIKKKILEIFKVAGGDSFNNLLPTGTSLYLIGGLLSQKIATYIMNHTRIFSFIAELMKKDFDNTEKRKEIIDMILNNIHEGDNILNLMKKELGI
ncbi:MAG: hypothetical protein Q8N63_04215 [Nanoarchaeota archaeon]|nr:hypothetical protein [Nanoarchaeota archaeon]